MIPDSVADRLEVHDKDGLPFSTDVDLHDHHDADDPESAHVGPRDHEYGQHTQQDLLQVVVLRGGSQQGHEVFYIITHGEHEVGFHVLGHVAVRVVREYPHDVTRPQHHRGVEAGLIQHEEVTDDQ